MKNIHQVSPKKLKGVRLALNPVVRKATLKISASSVEKVPRKNVNS